MSKSSTTSAPKISTQLPAKSAWSKGPPQTSSRPQSPAPPSTPLQSHSRRPSALGQGVPVKDGVSVPRSNVGAVKQQGSAVTFGSIDDVSAPVSSSPASAPPVRSEGVKSFGSVPNAGHTNGKAAVPTRPAAVPAASSSSSSSTTPAVSTSLKKPDIRKLFQNPSSAPSSQAPSDSSSPSMRPVNLPQSSASSSTSQPLQPSHMPQTYTPFVPRSSHQQPAGGPPRSPVYPRQVPNGTGPRSQGGPNGGPSVNMPSPRLAPHPHNAQPPAMPPPPPQMQPGMPVQTPVGWPYYYPQPEYYGWYMAQMPGQQPQQHPPPGPHGPPLPGMPMSPRNPPPALQPGTPTLSHAPAQHVPPPLSHSASVSSPPPTPSSSAMPTSARLNPGSSAFVPGSATPRKVTLKSPDGTEINLAKHSPSPSVTSLPPQPSSFRQGSPGVQNNRRVRLESEEQRKKRLEEAKAKEEEEKRKRDEEEAKARKAKEREEEEKRKKEEEEREKERKRKEEEEKERLRREDEERLRKQKEEEERKKAEEAEAERKRKEEEERRLKEEAERKAKEEEERKRKEEEEKERQRIAEEEAAKAKAAAEAASPPVSETPTKEDEKEEGEVDEETAEDVAAAAPAAQEVKEEPKEKEKSKEPLRINTGRHRPGPLDLSMTKGGINSPAPPSALATARIIEDINSISYPEGVQSPKPELNTNTKGGKFRYDRDFLLQFMNICKEKPDMLPPLDVLGLEPVDPAQHAMTRTSSGRGPKGSGPSRTPSVGMGFGPGGFGKPGGNPFSMGNFGTVGPKLSSDERFALSNNGRSASVGGAAGMPFNRPPSMTRVPSTGPNRTRSKRGEKRNESGNKASGGPPGYGSGYPQQPPAAQNLEPVVPLQPSANRWDRKALQADMDSPEMVDRKVKALLNKLTMEKFDVISDQIIAWANKSEKEKDGRTLIQVIRLVFEKATDEATWSEMYARLCRKMMEQISSKVQDEGIKNNEGKPIAGGQLFRKYLLNRCQEDFERGWVNKEATAAAAATKAMEDEATKAANEKNGGQEEVALYSDEYYAAQKAKRQGLGLIKFIGELFKLQMLTERIMHECVKKLLGNVENPEEEEIESLCKLLTTVGSILDTVKAKAHMDVYFSRMKELTKSPNVSSRMQFMLQDVIELRERRWVARNAVAAPSTLSQVHEAAKAEKDSNSRQMSSMSRGGSRRGGTRDEFPQVGPDGWAVAGGNAPRPPPKAGDLSQFGKISKAQPPTFGKPNSVFAGKKGGEKEAVSRSSSSSNMFMMLSQGSDAGDSKGESAPPQRKKLVLQPRSKPVEDTRPSADSEGSDEETSAAAPEMSESDADKKISEDLKEFFGVRNLDEAEVYFTALPEQFHKKLVDKLVSTAVESKEADAQLVADLFARAVSKKLCSSSAFVEGLTPIAEIIDDIAIDAPKAFQLFAAMVKGASLDESQRSLLASKSMDTEKLLSLLS